MTKRLSALGAALLAVVASPVLAGPQTGALAALEPGQWELRSNDPADPTLRICVRDLRELLQVRHTGQSCSRYVLEDAPTRTSVTYSCPRTGHGRTEIRVETSRLIQIDSQGVADGFPFAMRLEGRRTGACTTPNSHVISPSPKRPHVAIAPR